MVKNVMTEKMVQSHVLLNVLLLTHFVVTAYDTENLESDFSNEVMCADGVKPGTVINININCGQ